MTLQTLSFILGALLLLTGILGGGFEVKEIKIPKIGGPVRLIATVVGIAFIAIAIINPELRQDGGNKGLQTPTMSRMEQNTDRPGQDIQGFNLAQDIPELCQTKCKEDPRCEAWTYVKPHTIQGPKPRCWLKHTIPSPNYNQSCCISGFKIK